MPQLPESNLFEEYNRLADDLEEACRQIAEGLHIGLDPETAITEAREKLDDFVKSNLKSH